jgi:hypothetical protein
MGQGVETMEFIFMLTRQDQTIEDCLMVHQQIRPVGLKHVGFKDVGASKETLKALTEAIHDAGAMSYMEVVSTSPQSALRSAETAVELGVQRLLGGTQVDAVLSVIRGSKTEYYPFPGFPLGHPTKLGGKPADVAAHCRVFMERGCSGCDILAYRATESDPIALVRAAREGLGTGYLIVAGSMNSAARIDEIAAAGANAFTIGTAIFDGSYAPKKGSIFSQLDAVLADCAVASSKRRVA